MKRLAGLSMLCALIACGANGAGAPNATPSGQGGIVRGRVTAGPTCPVQRADSPCPERPVAATVSARSNGSIVTTTATDTDGNYSMDLIAGDYTIEASTGKPFPRPASVEVQVLAGETVTANISMDTGIR